MRSGAGKPDTTRLARHATDGAGLLQRLQMVLRGAHALEAECPRDLGLRGRYAIGLDPLGDEGEDCLLGIGQVHG